MDPPSGRSGKEVSIVFGLHDACYSVIHPDYPAAVIIKDWKQHKCSLIPTV